MELIDQPLRILIVDDDAVDRMMIRRVLKGATLLIDEVQEAEYGKDAIATLSSGRYDCALVDYLLPDLDGLELIHLLRADGVSLPLIVLTGQGDEETAVQFMKAGASDYVVKSRLNSDLMTQCIRSALRIHEAEEAVRRTQQQLQVTNALLLQQNQAVEEHRRQIQRQNVEVLRASRLKSEFLATMSHELRTPLNAIIGFSQLLIRRHGDGWTDQQVEMVNRIHSNACNLLSLLNEILDFSKLDARRLALRPEPMNLVLLAKETVAEMRSLAAQKSLSLTADIHLEPPIVTNDPARVRQILTNLISNAIKFTQSGSVEITLSAPNEDSVVLTVADTGVGMTPEEVAYIFEAFRQVDQSHTRKHTGTGLGLAIVDSLVTLMGGTINVESSPNEGTTFRVQLPRQVEKSS